MSMYVEGMMDPHISGVLCGSSAIHTVSLLLPLFSQSSFSGCRSLRSSRGMRTNGSQIIAQRRRPVG